MARYFDPQERSDELLLHSTVRSHDEIEPVSLAVEREVLRYYMERDPDTETLEVKLKDWDSDPANVEPQLAQALKETIAYVVSWRLQHYDEIQNVKSESLGEYSVEYAGESNPYWPEGWDERLGLWDEREVAWYV